MQKKYILRLDDACEKMDVEKWSRIEAILDKYDIKPLVGVIPRCEDVSMEKYKIDELFWNKVNSWISKGWMIAMHGYNHVYSQNDGGINPIHKRSEFAGEPLSVQKEKIHNGVNIFLSHNINPRIFFAPSHTFDENTLVALFEESKIRIISDTFAWDSYTDGSFVFIPQQCGKVRKSPFKTTTFCYHPNIMKDEDFAELDLFLHKYYKYFQLPVFSNVTRHLGFLDKLIRKLYFFLRKMRGNSK